MDKTYIKTIIQLSFILFLIYGCQTTKIDKDFKVPRKIRENFSNCIDGDGAFKASYFGNDGQELILNLDWIAKRSGWVAEAYSPLGQTLFRIDYSHFSRRLSSQGAFSRGLSRISVGKNGFIYINGEFLPIKAREFGCFLNMKWPGKWISNITGYSQSLKNSTLIFTEKERDIRTIFSANRSKKKRTCALVQWDVFWPFISSDITMCMDYGKPAVLSIKYSGELIMELEVQEG